MPSRPTPRRAAPRWGVVALALVTAAACQDTTPTDACNGDVDVITFERGPLTLTRLRGGEAVTPRYDDGCGESVPPDLDDVRWSSSDRDVVTVIPAAAGDVPSGLVRAVSFGAATITVAAEGAEATLPVEVVRPATEAQNFTLVDSGYVGRHTSALRAHGSYVYTGSRPWSCGDCAAETGWLYVWRIDADGGLTRVDSVRVPAADVTDIGVSADGSFAVIGQGGGGPGKNGIAVLDLSDPAAPTVVGSYHTGLENGAENVYVTTLQGRAYAFVAGTGAGGEYGMHVIDVTDPTAPGTVAVYPGDGVPVRDVFVRDGLAFVAHWTTGLVILDVGNGLAGGAPDAPVEVATLRENRVFVHTAWYWPARDLVFVGEYHFPAEGIPTDAGPLYAVDVSDLSAPTYVARYTLPDTPPHDIWLDEERGVLFAGWLENGLRAIDVSGPLEGELSGQGLDRGHLIPSGFRGRGQPVTPQLHDGTVYVADPFNGVWAARFDG